MLALTIVLVLSGCGAKTDRNKMDQGQMNHEGMNHNNASSHGKDIQTEWKFSNEKPQNNQDVQLSIQVKDDKGNPIHDFDVEHEKLMHLIVVSKDLSYFDHLHPEYKGKGLFTITAKFPSGGDYKLFADFVPKGTEKVTKSQSLTVQGDVPHSSAIEPDTHLTKVINGKEIALSYDNLAVGKEVMLNFNIKDAQTKQPIHNLQPYLGAVGHVVIISEDTEQYLHVHPMDEKAAGPDAKFLTTFTKSGVYKIWGQFQHEGKVMTVPFVVKVP
jgi:hypothetical protein